MRDDEVLLDAAALLAELADQRCEPEHALARVAELRARHPGRLVELIWDEEPALERHHYDLLVGRASGGTFSLSLASDDGVPFSLRGLQRWKEMEVVRVDGRSLWMHDAAALLGAIWGTDDVHRRIVDHCVIRAELEADPIEISDDELQTRLDEFRSSRGLVTPEQTEAWLRAHDLTLAELEAELADEAALAVLRRRTVGDRARALFDADPRAFDELQLVAFSADDAPVLAAEVRAGASFYAVAERVLATRTGAREQRSLIYEWFRRADVRCEEWLVAGATIAARIHGVSHVAAIRGVRAASWTPQLARELEQRLFADWLRERRERAHVEWNWGRT